MKLKSSFGSIFGFSDEHSSLVANVQYLSTGYISLQFHLVFYDLYEMFIHQWDNKCTIEAIRSDIFDINQYLYAKEEFGDAGNLMYRPSPLHSVWLDDQGCRDWTQDLAQQRKCTEDQLHERNWAIPEIISLNAKDDDNFSPRGSPILDDELSVEYSVGHPPSESEVF